MKDLFRITNWNKKDGLDRIDRGVSVMDSDSNRFEKIINKFDGYLYYIYSRGNRILFAIIEDDEYCLLFNESLLPESEVVEPIVDFLEKTFEESKKGKG